MAVIFLSLGSNLGDRELYLRAGIQGLQRRGVEIVRQAALYETEPKDMVDQPWFLNTVAEAKTRLSPHELLLLCLEVERKNGRVRTAALADRTLDIDIVFYDDRVIRETGLTVPHPRFAERRFVLVPMAEIAPGFIDPESGLTIAALLDRCSDPSQVRLRQ